MDPRWRIAAADFDDPRLTTLIDLHLKAMRGFSPVGCAHVLDAAGLRVPGVELFVLSEGGAPIGMGALKAHDDGVHEIKSMRVHPDHLGRGVGRVLLEHLIDTALARGGRRISLETGSGATFEAALALYRQRGFVPGPTFGGYTGTDFNQFLHLDLVPV